MKRSIAVHVPVIAAGLTIGLATQPAFAWLWGDDHPTESEIRAWVSEVLPEHFDIRQMSVEGQEMEQGLFEFSRSAVMFGLETDAPLFVRAEPLEDQTPVIEMVADGSIPVQVDLPVFVEAVPGLNGGWDTNILWDNNILYEIGRPRSMFSDRALVSGSPEFEAHVASLERARDARYESVSGEFSGLMDCHEGVFEIDLLRIDARESTGSLVYRPATNPNADWSELDLEVANPHGGERFFLYGVPHNDMPNLRVTARPDGAPVPAFDGDCDFHLYPEEEIPDAILQKRSREERALSGLNPGPIPARLTEDDVERAVTVRILEVFERGFSMEIDHPMRMNGNLNGSDENRAISIMDVRFVDDPLQAVITGTVVEGRGDVPIHPRCGAMATALEDGSILLEGVQGPFWCDERLLLMR